MNLVRIKYWLPKKDVLRTKYFYSKCEIVFGADKQADISIGSKGFLCRLDTRSESLEFFETGESLDAKEASLFFLEDCVFQWQRISLASLIQLKSILLVLISAAIVFSCSFFLDADDLQCGPIVSLLQENSWESKKTLSNLELEKLNALVENRNEVKILIKRKDFLAARSALLHLEASLRKEASDSRCIFNAGYIFLYEEWANAYGRNLILASKVEEAAKLFQVSRKQVPTASLYPLRDQIQKQAKKIYWKAWKLENLRPKKSQDLLAQAAFLCKTIGSCSGNNSQ